MGRPLFDEGVFALARLALKTARGALVDMNADPDAERATVLDRFATPIPRSLIRKVGSRHLPAVIAAHVAAPYHPSTSRHLRRGTFDLWHADLTRLGGGIGRLWRDVLVEAHIFPRLTPSGRLSLFLALEEVLV